MSRYLITIIFKDYDKKNEEYYCDGCSLEDGLLTFYKEYPIGAKEYYHIPFDSIEGFAVEPWRRKRNF